MCQAHIPNKNTMLIGLPPMWNGFLELLLWLARPFHRTRLYRQTVLHDTPPGRDHPLHPSLEKENDQLQIKWMVHQCPSFRFNLNHIASQVHSIEVMRPMLNIAPIQLAVYYTKQPQLTTPQKPTVVSQEPSGLITINALPIHQPEGTDTFNLCGVSTVHSSPLPPLTHTDLLHPSSIALGTDQMPMMQFLQHWTKVLEQLSPALKGLIRVVVMIDHTALHGHQDFSPHQIIMTIPKERITYTVPPTAFQQVLPQHLPDLQLVPILPEESPPPQTFPPPPTPPQSRHRRTPTPIREEPSPSSSDHMSLQTSASDSSRTSSPGSSASTTLTPRYTKCNGPRQGVLELPSLQN